MLVTGATGNVGREVVRELRARGVPLRAVDVSVDRVRAQHGDDLDVRRLDYEDPGTFAGALEGCTTLFLVRPLAIADMETTLLPFIDEAVASGITHIVFLSALGAESNRLVPHHAVEAHLASCGASHTLLRPGFFAQNLGTAYRADIADDGRLFLPAGRGRVAFVVTKAPPTRVRDPRRSRWRRRRA